MTDQATSKRAAITADTAGARPATTRTRYRVVEGCCLDCAGDLGRVLGRLPGVEQVSVLATAGLVVVDHDGRLADDQVQQQAARLGLRLAPDQARPEQAEPAERARWQRPNLLALAAAGVLLLAGLAAEHLARTPTLATVFYLASVVAGGVYPLRGAIRVLRQRQLTIGTLLVIATLGALALGVVEEAALLVVVFSLGEVLEDYAADRARGAVRALMALSPPTAPRRNPDGTTSEVAVEDLVPGELVVVRPGERLPSDGEVAAGSSAVDQSPVTGESMPVEATPGRGVFGGTVNGTGALTVRVTKPYQDTTLARIIRQVQEAQAHRGHAQRFADRFGAVYTPAMIALAALLAIVPPLAGGEWHGWIYRGLVVLAVSCSCALVISVPVAVVAAISRAARDGILIKGGAYLEALGRIRVVTFDKIGTLTQGRPHLTDVHPLDASSAEEILVLAAAVEAASEHPLAGAILAGARECGRTWPQGSDLRALPGVGVEATVRGRRLFVGRPDGRVALDEADCQRLAQLEAQGKTAVVLADADAGRALGVLAVADELRPNAANAIAAVHQLGIGRVVMLTGDNQRTAQAIAAQAGLDDWRAGLLPEDKTAAVTDLRRAHGATAMVGDGVNDAPALATADVGIAMGAAGTDVALETADVALMADDLAKLPQAIRLARRALVNIRQNIALSLATIAVLVAAALAGGLSLTSGLLLNEGTALLIIANGLRLLRSPLGTAIDQQERPPAAGSRRSVSLPRWGSGSRDPARARDGESTNEPAQRPDTSSPPPPAEGRRVLPIRARAGSKARPPGEG